MIHGHDGCSVVQSKSALLLRYSSSKLGMHLIAVTGITDMNVLLFTGSRWGAVIEYWV
jgi:hypothetical protein